MFAGKRQNMQAPAAQQGCALLRNSRDRVARDLSDFPV